MSSRLNLTFNEDELARLDKALEFSGLRSRAELVRFLVTSYIKEFYDIDELTSDE